MSHRTINEHAASVAIALDIGGTKIAAGLVDDLGNVTQRTTIPTDAAEGAYRIATTVSTGIAGNGWPFQAGRPQSAG